MRRLGIAWSDVFLLVAAVNNPASVDVVKDRLLEISEQRKSDFLQIPITIAINKADLTGGGHEELKCWIRNNFPLKSINIMGCSAKTGENIKKLFKTLLAAYNLKDIVVTER